MLNFKTLVTGEVTISESFALGMFLRDEELKGNFTDISERVTEKNFNPTESLPRNTKLNFVVEEILLPATLEECILYVGGRKGILPNALGLVTAFLYGTGPFPKGINVLGVDMRESFSKNGLQQPQVPFIHLGFRKKILGTYPLYQKKKISGGANSILYFLQP